MHTRSFHVRATLAVAALASLPVLAQSWQADCQYVGVPTREAVGDRDNHALGGVQYTCRVLNGPLADAVLTGNNLFEWNGPRAVALFAEGVYRKPGTVAVFQVSQLNASVQVADGKPVGNTSSGTARFQLATGDAAPFAGKHFKFASKATGMNRFLLDTSIEETAE